MDGLGLLGEKYDLPVQSHLAENPSEVAWVRQLHPDVPGYAQVYERHGLLRRGRTIMAHCIYLSPEERALLKEREVTLAHCPASNADLASGISPCGSTWPRASAAAWPATWPAATRRP